MADYCAHYRGGLVAVLAAVLQLPAALGAPGDPEIIDYQLQSKVRVSRTAYQYSYRVTIQVRQDGFPAGATFTLINVPSGTTAIDPIVTTVPLATFSIVTPTDTFTIRHDRIQAYDPANLVWQVAGDRVTAPPPDLELTTFEFVAEQGRQDHQGLLPIAGNAPSGNRLVLAEFSVPVFNVSVALTDNQGQPLGVYSLEPKNVTAQPAVTWSGAVVIPSQSFGVRVLANTGMATAVELPVGKLGTLTVPSSTQVDLAPPSVTLFEGEQGTAILRIRSSEIAPGSVQVSAWPPPGITVTPSSASVDLDGQGEGQALLTVATAGYAGDLPALIKIPITVNSVSAVSSFTTLTLEMFLYPSQ